MKPNDFLPNQVHCRRPQLRETLLRFGPEADAAQVSGQCVEPHVKDVAWIIRNRNSPLELGSTDRKVLQTASDERNDFIAPRFRPDEARLLLVQIQKFFLK